MQKADPDKQPELGMQQHCRDNVTMFQAKKIIGGLLSLFSVATPFRHRGLNNFSGPWCSILLSRCRCREAKKLSRAQLCNQQYTVCFYVQWAHHSPYHPICTFHEPHQSTVKAGRRANIFRVNEREPSIAENFLHNISIWSKKQHGIHPPILY